MKKQKTNEEKNENRKKKKRKKEKKNRSNPYVEQASDQPIRASHLGETDARVGSRGSRGCLTYCLGTQ